MTETKSNDLCEIIAQAFEQMKERDSDFSSENVNLAELSRSTGLSRQRLRRLNHFWFKRLMKFTFLSFEPNVVS